MGSSVCVLQQILTVMCGHLIKNVPMLQGRDINFTNGVLVELAYEVFQEGDVIVHQDAPADRMFFIEHGQVMVENESCQTELCDGDFFGGGSNSPLNRFIYSFFKKGLLDF